MWRFHPHFRLGCQRDKRCFLCRHLVLHGLPAALHVAVGQDDALLVHPRLLLHVGLQHTHFQAAAQHDGGVACVAANTRKTLSGHKTGETLYASCLPDPPSTFNDLGDLGLVGVKFKGCEEAQGAQVEGHNWRDALLRGNHAKDGVVLCEKNNKNGQRLTAGPRTAGDLEERRSVEQSSISAEADDEVHAVGDVVKICRRERETRPNQKPSQKSAGAPAGGQPEILVPSLKVQNFLVMAPKFSSPDMAGSSRTFFST